GRALAAVERARASATRDLDELARVTNDAEALGAIARFYALRIEAAVEIGVFRERQAETARLVRASELVNASVEVYRRLTDIAGPAYL
ncbi:hypothetical protein SB782_35210, partial [Brevibacillus sp. SIMBA_076]|uniref:hypothetical protein n=1 Tax=Brevibacillus sp. SIMBA_076 TaxID=3085814 RepID=UPI00397DC6A3